MTDTSAPNDFDVAKKIFDELKGLSRDRQERVLRWVAESASIPLFASNPSAPKDTSSSNPPSPPNPLGSSPRDIRSFVAEKAPASDNQFAAVVAYYYRFEAPPSQKKNTIGGADLQEAARLAGRKRLSNPRQTLKNAKNMGYLDNVSRGEFSINTVGENLVAMTLPGGADTLVQRRGAKKTGARAQRRGSRAKGATRKRAK